MDFYIIFSNICLMCKRLMYSIKKRQYRLLGGKKVNPYFSPSKKAALKKLRNNRQIMKVRAIRSNLKIKRLQSSLNENKQKLKAISKISVLDIIKKYGLSNMQSDLLQQIISSAKVKNTKNRRYSQNWMMLCLLFQIR